MFNNSDKKTTVKVFQKAVPEIIFNPDALIKMGIYTAECEDEVGWLGTAYKDNNKNIIYINDVFLFDQETHSTTTEISSEGLSSFGEELLATDSGLDTWNNLKVWGHSHVNMATSPSGQDDEQMETFLNTKHDWFIRIITNKKSEMRVDLYYFDQGIIYMDLPWDTHYSSEELTIKQEIEKLQKLLEDIEISRLQKYEDSIKEEIKTKVRKKVQKSQVWGSPHTNPHKNDVEFRHETSKKKDYPDKKNETEDDITTVTEAHHFFSEYQDFLLDVGLCETLVDVKASMWQHKFNPTYFSEEELRLIWVAGREMADHTYFGGNTSLYGYGMDNY